MKELYDKVSQKISKVLTNSYSTSFSIGIRALSAHIRNDIYAIYGFVRLADEIVDSFHDFDKKTLLDELKKETYQSIERRISTNPILNNFQETVNKYKIDNELIDAFFRSMENDLYQNVHSYSSYNDYIYGSAEVVGLMCLRVFVNGNDEKYMYLKPYAQALGAAFQKVNFLRDMKDDYYRLGRIYFPSINFNDINSKTLLEIKSDIENDFRNAEIGIRQLPDCCKFGVYVAYVYYKGLFYKILSLHPSMLLKQRIRISNFRKILLFLKSFIEYKMRYV
ncbi:MAG: phytoene/squalene synthase family protein [Bacteroidia bacterium]|nr:phytoene/squalene synthase family protein [Bacteroidia bacterium]